MDILIRAALALALVATPVAAFAQDNTTARIEFDHPWARVIMMSRPAAGFVTVHNRGDTADRIVAVRSPMAERVELHNHIMEGNVMMMRPVDAIEIPAGGRVSLEPGGLHLMIFGLKQLPKKGDSLPVTLEFERAGAVDLDLMVGDMSGASEHGKTN